MATGTVNSLVSTLNSKITNSETISVTLASTITSDNLLIQRIGKLVTISGGVASKTSDPVTFAHLEPIITGGLPNAVGNASIVFMAMNFATGSNARNQYRLRVSGGKIEPFWDTVTVPKSGQPLYINVCYISA